MEILNLYTPYGVLRGIPRIEVIILPWVDNAEGKYKAE